IWKISVSQDAVGWDILPILQPHPTNPLSCDFDLLYPLAIGKFYPGSACHIAQGFHDLVHAPAWIPHAVGNLGKGHHGKRGRSFKGAQSHVNILEGKGRLEPRGAKEGCHVVIMTRKRFKGE